MTEELRERWEAAGAGALAGLAGGVVAAVGDFGALWLWLTGARDRAELLLRLVASLGALGVLGGAAAGAIFAVGARWGRRMAAAGGRAWLVGWGGPLALAASCVPFLAWVVVHALGGARVSKLPLHGPLVGVTLLSLVAGVAVVARVLGSALGAGASRRMRLAVAVVGALAYAVLSKADQRLYPNLYPEVHALLAVLAWTSASLAALAGASLDESLAAYVARLSRARGKLVAGALVAFAANAVTLPLNPNVRVALFDPRAATSKSATTVVQPLMRATVDRFAAHRATQALRAARERRKAALLAGMDLPSWEGAHVLLITVDALRPDHLGAYGYGRPTSPAIDAVAREGVVFERAYAQAPHSSFSLSSIMASEYLHETVELGQPLPEATLPRVLEAKGYHTAAYFTEGIFHTEGKALGAYADTAFGFKLRQHELLPAARLTDAVLEDVERLLADGEPPAFYWVHYFDAHEPYESTHFGRAPMDRYDGEIRAADAAIGRLIREFEARLARDVVVLLTADHGEEFREHGGVYHGSTLYEEQVRVPFILRAPDLEPRRVPMPVELVDVAPTLLSMVGLAPAPSMRGDDLRAMALGRIPEMGPAFASVMHKRMTVRWPLKSIADLRFQLFELYDLAADPKERNNLAKSRPADLAALLGETDAWLDALAVPRVAGGDSQGDPLAVALARGKLGDRRVAPTLLEAAGDRTVDPLLRAEAVRNVGMLADPAAVDALATLLRDADGGVRAEAAIALGRLFDGRGRSALHGLVAAPSRDTRTRAAVALGRLRDRAAVPALMEAAEHATATYDREEAIRWLGRLRDARGFETVRRLVADQRLRHLTGAALGLIGAPGAREALLGMLTPIQRSDVRDQAIRGLGYLRDASAVDAVLAQAVAEPGLRNASETLVRLGAIALGRIGGVDVAAGARGVEGVGACHENDFFHDWDFRQHTWCETRGAAATVRFAVPRDVGAGGGALVVSLRRVDSADAALVRLTAGAHAELIVDARKEWSEVRLPLPGPVSRVTLRIAAEDPAVRLGLDHVLFYPAASLPAPSTPR